MPGEICQSCKKKEAKVHLTEIANGKKREVHLCAACAAKQGIQPMDPHAILSSMAEPARDAAGVESDLTCSRCGLSFSEFRRRGRLGCGDCYRVFREGLLPLLERIHGNTQHLGRVPEQSAEDVPAERELTLLKRELARAVQCEEYERAAGLRDQVRRLEERESGGSD